MVDTCFAADGCVHLRQQGRWHVDQPDAAQIGGSGKADQVAHDTAAKGHQRIAALGALVDQPVPDSRELLQVLVGFRARYSQQPCSLYVLRDSCAVQVERALVSHDEEPASEVDFGQSRVQLCERVWPGHQRHVSAARAQGQVAHRAAEVDAAGRRWRCQASQRRVSSPTSS